MKVPKTALAGIAAAVGVNAIGKVATIATNDHSLEQLMFAWSPTIACSISSVVASEEEPSLKAISKALFLSAAAGGFASMGIMLTPEKYLEALKIATDADILRDNPIYIMHTGIAGLFTHLFYRAATYIIDNRENLY